MASEQVPTSGLLTPDIVVATLMRPAGGSGVQSHVRTFQDYLAASSRPAGVVNPFSSRSPLLPVVFGARIGIRRVSRPAGVWWYRRWHASFLQHALAEHLAGDRRSVVYAQCPVSADVALRTRTTQPVVMAAHFNVSQADEWAQKNEIPRDGAYFRSIRSFEERVLPGLDGIVYVSEFTKALLEERMPALRRVPDVVIPNAVAPPAHDRPEPTTDLISVGALEPRKNQGYLLEVLSAAARRGRRYTLSVVGDGPDRRKLEARTRDLGLTDQIRFLGYQADPRRLMRGHRLYCHTSTMESFGIVLVEAMAEGLPVLAGAVGGVPEVVRPGLGGQFWPLDDANTAADVLIALMEDPAKREDMAVAAVDRARTEYSPEVVGARLLDFLEACGLRSGR